MTQERKCLNYDVLFYESSLYLSTCLNGWVYDQELGLYWLNSAEPPLLKQIPCGSLTCIALVDFVCWNCAFHIVICLFLDLDSMFRFKIINLASISVWSQFKLQVDFKF